MQSILHYIPYVIAAILVFSVLIIGHELGHFILAKLNGVKVNEFSLGMGKKLWSIKGKETEYSIRIAPIGGFVAMEGEGEESTDPRSFSQKSPLQRISIIVAGPLMNFVMAILFFAISSYMIGVPSPEVSAIVPNSPAYEANLEIGDKITKVNNENVNTWDDFTLIMSRQNGSPMAVQLERNGEIIEKTIVPEQREKGFIVGITGKLTKPTVGKALKNGFSETGTMMKETFKFFGSLFRGEVSKDDVGGPVSIIKLSVNVAQQGLAQLIFFAAFLSVQLGIFNLIPFPALDGGWTVILLIELITRKKIDDNKLGIINGIGFMCLIGLMILVTIKDIISPIKF